MAAYTITSESVVNAVMHRRPRGREHAEGDVVMSLDPVDRAALSRLMTEGRSTWAELAQRLGLSSVAAAQRVRRLERAGVILGYAARVDPAAVGLGLMAFVGVVLASRARERFLARVAVLPEVQECHHVTGEFDYLLKIRCVGTRELEQLINEELKQESGVASSRTVVVLSSAKETTALPLPGAAPRVKAGRRRR